MPLIDLKTDLTSIKYGQDRPGGGDSGQPFIVTTPSGGTSVTIGPNNVLRILGINRIPTIPNISTQLSRSRIGQVINQVGYDDSLIRGGVLGAAQSSLNDFFRIGAYLATVPKGPIFIAKQVGLQLSNPRLEVKKGGRGILSGLLNFGGLLGTLTGGILGPTRVYNLGINTLAQVPVNAFGGHITRHGILPIQSNDTKYEAVVTFNNESDNSQNNRLVGLVKKFELGDNQFEASRLFNLGLARKQNRQSNRAGRQINRAKNRKRKLPPEGLQVLTSFPNPFLLPPPPRTKFKRQKLDTTSLTVDSYIGGPGSLYGVGLTVINRYSFTEDKLKIDEAFENASNYSGRSRLDALTPDYVKALSTNNQFQPSEYAISEYGPDIPVSSSGITPAIDQGAYKVYSLLKNAVDDTTNITQAIPFVSGGYTPSTYTSTISTNGNIGLNRGAAGAKYYGNGSSPAEYSGSRIEYNNTDTFARQDSAILSVVFRAVNPFSAPPGNTETWIFPAYMTGFKDGFDASWNETNYVGRSESFFIYSRFKRNVSFNLKIPCFNKIQLFEKHRALGQLASVTAGAYNQAPNGSVLGGVLLKINVGNYLVGEYAVLNSVSYSIPDDASWDVSNDALLSMYIDANFNMTIVHKELPRYQQSSKTVLNNGFYGYLPNPVNTQQQTRTGFITPQEVVNKFTKD